jgi:hypothetical protein
MSETYRLPKIIEDKKIKLDLKINQLISDFEKQTNTKVMMFVPNKKPFELALLIDGDEIQLELH